MNVDNDIIHNSPKLEAIKCPSIWRINEQTVVYPCMEYHSAVKTKTKHKTAHTCGDMAEPQKHYDK